jgi:hypothetical protein
MTAPFLFHHPFTITVLIALNCPNYLYTPKK